VEITVDPTVLAAYGYTQESVTINEISSGLINRTYLITSKIGKEQYILQKINTLVFKNPNAIAHNISLIADYLHQNFPEYLFIAIKPTINGEEMAHIKQAYWRMQPFIANTIALNVLTQPKQAYEASKQFGKLSKLLNKFDISALEPTIPNFHNLEVRFQQYTDALANTSPELKNKASVQINDALAHKYILDYYQSYKQRSDFPDRVMHHDTKISNVLLNAETFEGVCVIDLDTIMPGKFISDLGDMMRTYLCAFSENETDLSKIKIRLPYFEAMIKGYLSEMKNSLTETEKELILFSGKYMIYMQALRFLSDFLNGNIYYQINYPEQNLDRAKNQFKLLVELSKNEKELQDIIEENLI